MVILKGTPKKDKGKGIADPLAKVVKKTKAKGKGKGKALDKPKPPVWILGLPKDETDALDKARLRINECKAILGNMSAEAWKAFRTDMKQYYAANKIKNKTAAGAPAWAAAMQYALTLDPLVKFAGLFGKGDEQAAVLEAAVNTLLTDAAKNKGNAALRAVLAGPTTRARAKAEEDEEEGEDEDEDEEEEEEELDINTREIQGICKANRYAYFGRPVAVCYHWPEDWRIEEPVDPDAGEAADAVRRKPCSRSFIQPAWVPIQASPDIPFLAHFQLRLPTFDYLLKAIRHRYPSLLREGGEWTPRQIYGALRDPTCWFRVTDTREPLKPFSGDIVTIADDEDVRTWLAATKALGVLHLLVVFNQVDYKNEQTPPPLYRSYLADDLLDNLETNDEEEDEDEARADVPGDAEAEE